MKFYVVAIIAAILSVSCSGIDNIRCESTYQRYNTHTCEVCEATNNVEVCHIYPQCDYPDRKNDRTNVVILCRPCHMCLSHYHNTSRYWNVNLRQTVDLLKEGKRSYKKYEEECAHE